MGMRLTLRGAVEGASFSRVSLRHLIDRGTLKHWKDGIIERLHNDWDQAIIREPHFATAKERIDNVHKGLQWVVQAMLHQEITQVDQLPPDDLVRMWIWITLNAPEEDAALVDVVEAYEARQLELKQLADRKAHWERVKRADADADAEHSLDKGHRAEISERTAQRYGLDKRSWEAEWARRLARRA
ncbi:hypothetical protein JCM3775_006055 [Rhodotorula graminis]|uniref:Uncharacterized protein n=1 Tax=Rhodotorula graminis (strain WP1) TaxID=578459 RepID=A0A194S9V7_RHOGW|nr:uncharacterized protein RHOBADRAFT_41384 [Rhodotorula graminis WP1]KPV77392.1 hypothetical protein RHOBADRAFT_41384 [Rhodotorula graminis WP1]